MTAGIHRPRAEPRDSKDRRCKKQQLERRFLVSESSLFRSRGERPRAARLPKYVTAGCQGPTRKGWPCENRAHWEVIIGGTERPISDGGGGPLLVEGGRRLLVCGAHCQSIFKEWDQKTSSTLSPAERAVEWVFADPRKEMARTARRIASLRERLRRLKAGPEPTPSYLKGKAGEVGEVDRGV